MTPQAQAEAAWEAQRDAQQRLGIEQRLCQNDALSRLFVESSRYRRLGGGA